MLNYPAIPIDEIKRLLSLSALDINYTEVNDTLKDLTRLAAGIAGTNVSLINLVDAYTQWTIAAYGLPEGQIPREDSVCQYTILEQQQLEVPDLSADERFKDKEYVAGDAKLIYYFGVPLKTAEGQNIGALCILDKTKKVLDNEKAELLKIVAKEIVSLLTATKVMEYMTRKLSDMTETQNKLAHDIRGPIAGITGLAKLFKNRVYETNPNKLQEVLTMIENGGESILVLAEDILNNSENKKPLNNRRRDDQYNLSMFKEVIENLYLPMAKSKSIHFDVIAEPGKNNIFFPKKMLMQICGNLVSNAMKFTPVFGKVVVNLDLQLIEKENIVRISVQDSGAGISVQTIHKILKGAALSTEGTNGESGYGYGLALVKRLVHDLGGRMEVSSGINNGTQFDIWLPQKNGDVQINLPKPVMSLVA
ncbi:MAG: GAF domain-containing sensor histidine kinase [Ferruginibacter sp.]